MADDAMTPGEIKRTFDRQDGGLRATNDRLAELARQMVPTDLWAAQHRSLEVVVAELKEDAKAGFTRVEATSQERRAALMAKDVELEARIDALRKDVFRKIGEVESEFNAKLKAERERASSEETRGTARAANWIAIVIALASVAALLVTLLGQGGH